jgi:putative transposase
LKDNAIQISMDGRGRALDNIFVERLWRNVKYEDVYPKNFASMPELLMGLAEYFIFLFGTAQGKHNGGRFHQALGYKTPDQVYRTGDGGGAKIADHFGDQKASLSEETGQQPSAVTETTPS